MTAHIWHSSLCFIFCKNGVAGYNPDPRAYQLSVDAFGPPRKDILFVAFAGRDAARAKAFGFPTFWVNRLNLPPEEPCDRPDGRGGDLADLVKFLDV